jgi:hypothetical protein
MRFLLAVVAIAILSASPSASEPPFDMNSALAEWQPVKMPFDSTGLTVKQKQMVDELVRASQQLDLMYWHQSDPEGLRLLRTTSDTKLKRMLTINGCRFDLLHDNRQFAPGPPFRPGRNLYPPDLTRVQIEDYVARHPDQKAEIYNPLTVLRRDRQLLRTVPYNLHYREELEPAAHSLLRAADLSDDAAFANFLRLRAAALLDDDYYKSDSAWVNLKNPKIDLIYAPYETYLDDVLGVKASWGSAVLIRNEPESAKLAIYEKYVPQIQNALPLAPLDKPSMAGKATPLEVMDSPFRSGDLRHGYQAVADNLPNDPRIHAEKGTKKIFFKNFMDARVNYVILPLAKQVMRPEQAQLASAEGYLAAVVLHEISHGLGPAYSRVGGKQVEIRASLGPVYAALEEAKADIVGLFGLHWLIDHGGLPSSREDEYYASYIAGVFRTVRYGIAEAHGRAEMMEFNYLRESKAIEFSGGRFIVNFDRMAVAISSLAKELLELEATGDAKGAESWFSKYDKMPADLDATLKAVKGVPVDIDPISDWPELPRETARR